jgi:hypothetical protein
MVSWSSRDSSAVLNTKHCLEKAKCSEEIVKREPGFATKICTECTRSQTRIKCIYHPTNSEAVGHELLEPHDSMDQDSSELSRELLFGANITCWRKQKGSKESREEDEKMTHGLLEEEGSTETREGQDKQWQMGCWRKQKGSKGNQRRYKISKWQMGCWRKQKGSKGNQRRYKISKWQMGCWRKQKGSKGNQRRYKISKWQREMEEKVRLAGAAAASLVWIVTCSA